MFVEVVSDLAPSEGSHATGCNIRISEKTMSEQSKMEATAREMAHACLARRRSALEVAGLRARVEIERWQGTGLRGSELRITFWRDTALIDVVEDFILEDGQFMGSREELQRWLDEGIDDVLKPSTGL